MQAKELVRSMKGNQVRIHLTLEGQGVVRIFCEAIRPNKPSSRGPGPWALTLATSVARAF